MNEMADKVSAITQSIQKTMAQFRFRLTDEILP